MSKQAGTKKITSISEAMEKLEPSYTVSGHLNGATNMENRLRVPL